MGPGHRVTKRFWVTPPVGFCTSLLPLPFPTVQGTGSHCFAADQLFEFTAVELDSGVIAARWRSPLEDPRARTGPRTWTITERENHHCTIMLRRISRRGRGRTRPIAGLTSSSVPAVESEPVNEGVVESSMHEIAQQALGNAPDIE
ncbi:hypothetical protein WN944_024283 [Citrus x changshan-huyou]|uniref:Uncharacterized protein n=1 Tax=Citrus x changshan-huyou TaxID=2935761 RepID=A0AAP0QB35_9ROSI